MNKQNYQVLKKALMVYIATKPQQSQQANNYLGDLKKYHPELLAIFKEIIEIEEGSDTLSILDHTLSRKVGSTHQQS